LISLRDIVSPEAGWAATPRLAHVKRKRKRRVRLNVRDRNLCIAARLARSQRPLTTASMISQARSIAEPSWAVLMNAVS
jgi:hypothetical protein